MNLSEFKAWFEGYTENMKDAPTAKQWARIKERVGEITHQATEIRYFYDHYLRPQYAPYWYAGTAGVAGTASNSLSAASMNGSLDSTSAFLQLGRAQSLAEAS